MSIIKPTVGRKVWFRLNGQRTNLRELSPDQPMDATILHVWSDRCVNLLVNDHIGNTWCPQSVQLVQDGDFKPQGGSYAEWMPYQQGQAKKALELSEEELELLRPGKIQVFRTPNEASIGVDLAAPGADKAIELEIQAKGLTAPRITPADIEAAIDREFYFTAHDGWSAGAPQSPKPGSLASPAGLSHITICVLLLRNGTKIVGANEGPVSPENFDPDMGRQMARQKAVDQVWPLLGYALRSKLAADKAS